MFTKEERSTFKYWFAHWCAFQMTALNLKAWKPKYLLHDIEKPWLRLFWPYKKVQHWHRTHSNHHLEWLDYHTDHSKFDWEAMMIDWECARFTKISSPRTAREELELQLNLKYMEAEGNEEKNWTAKTKREMKERVELIDEMAHKALDTLGL